MGSQLSLQCASCRQVSKFSVNRAQDSLACMSCGRHFPGVQIETFDGCVYVLSNLSMPGLLKIGMTQQDAFARARELSSATGVPEPYVVEAYITCGNAASIELAAHRELAYVRKPNREFFAVSLDDALRVLEKLVGKRADYQREERSTWVPPSLSSASKSQRTRDSSIPGRGPVKFKLDCPHCGDAHWFDRGSRPSECSGCKRSLAGGRAT